MRQMTLNLHPAQSHDIACQFKFTMGFARGGQCCAQRAQHRGRRNQRKPSKAAFGESPIESLGNSLSKPMAACRAGACARRHGMACAAYALKRAPWTIGNEGALGQAALRLHQVFDFP